MVDLYSIEFASGLSPTLQKLTAIIWIIFIIDFLIEISISPDKKTYLKSNWLIVLSLFLPALRILRIFSAFRILKATSFYQVFKSCSRPHLFQPKYKNGQADYKATRTGVCLAAYDSYYIYRSCWYVRF